MNATPQRQPSMTGKPELIRTQLGFDLLADPNDYVSTLIVRNGVYEVPETDLVTRIVRPGDICIDAGCQIGYYSCLMGKLAGGEGRVFSFDANPQACQSTQRNLHLNGLNSAEVIHAALADHAGTASFHIASDDQTGLSSLGQIPAPKETISVPCIRLDTFLDGKQIERIRLLKVDVEGAEEIVLKGLGRYLTDHTVDFVLMECYDERLQLLSTSTGKLAALLQASGYRCWEFGTQCPAGWSETTNVLSRGDCNYLFVSPSVTEKAPIVTLALAEAMTQAQRNQVLNEKEQLRKQLLDEKDKLQDDIDWLLNSIRVLEQKEAMASELAKEKEKLEAIWRQVEGSISWRVLNKWRKVRNRLAPEDTLRRRFCQSLVRAGRKKL